MKKNVWIASAMFLVPFLTTPQRGYSKEKETNKTSKSAANSNNNVVGKEKSVDLFEDIKVDKLEDQYGYYLAPPSFISFDYERLRRGIGTSDSGAGDFGTVMNMHSIARKDFSYADFKGVYGAFGTHSSKLSAGTGLINNKFSLDGQLGLLGSDYLVGKTSNLQSYFLSGSYYGANSILRANVFIGREGSKQNFEGELGKTIDNAKSFSPITRARADHRFGYTDGETDLYKQDHYQLMYSNKLSEKFSLSTSAQFSKKVGYREGNNDLTLDQQLYPAVYQFVSQPKENTNLIQSQNTLRRHSVGSGFLGADATLSYKLTEALKLTFEMAFNQFKAVHFDEVLWISGLSKQFDKPLNYHRDNANKTNVSFMGSTTYELNNKTMISADAKYRRAVYDLSIFDPVSSMSEKQDKFNAVNTDDFDLFDGGLGLMHKLNGADELHASFSFNSKEPGRKEYILRRFAKEDQIKKTKPEVELVKKVQLGYRTDRKIVKGGVSVFGRFYQNQFVGGWDPNQYNDCFDQNVKDSYRVGFEFDGQLAITPKFTFTTTGVLSRNRIAEFKIGDETYKNKAISFSPNVVVSNELAFKPVQKWEVALVNKYIGKQYTDNTQNEDKTQAAFFVDDLRLSYKTSFQAIKALEFTLLVNNVFGVAHKTNSVNNYSYLENGSMANKDYYLPSNHQNLMFGVKMSF